MTSVIAGTKIYARHKKTGMSIIGVTKENHDFGPGASSLLSIQISTYTESPVPDIFGIEINCNEWAVYELKLLTL